MIYFIALFVTTILTVKEKNTNAKESYQKYLLLKYFLEHKAKLFVLLHLVDFTLILFLANIAVDVFGTATLTVEASAVNSFRIFYLHFFLG